MRPLIQPPEEIRLGQSRKRSGRVKRFCGMGVLDSVAALPLWGDLGSGGCDRVGSGLVERAFFFVEEAGVFGERIRFGEWSKGFVE